MPDLGKCRNALEEPLKASLDKFPEESREESLKKYQANFLKMFLEAFMK